MPLSRMGEGLGIRPTTETSQLLSTTLPRLDPARFGLADYDFYGGPVNFAMAKANGLRRPIIRVGQGYYGIDAQFKASAANSKGLFSRDFYWMLDAHQSANGQAATCIDNLINYGKLDSDSILFADFELAPVNASFLYGFLTTAHTMLGSLRLGIYTGLSYWATYGSTAPSWAQYPLWISWPIDPYREPPVPKPWPNYYYHQWTFAGDGLFYGQKSAGLDLDYENPIYASGTYSPPTGTNPVPATNVKWQVIGVPGDNLRSSPDFTPNIVGYLPNGATIYGTLTPDGKFVHLDGYVAKSVLKEIS